jgi:hypothetical protein
MYLEFISQKINICVNEFIIPKRERLNGRVNKRKSKRMLRFQSGIKIKFQSGNKIKFPEDWKLH